MIPILGRCTLLLAVLAAACGDDCPDGGGVGPGHPGLFLLGTWEGREAPFGPNGDTYPWWQFDLQDGGRHGTLATDRPVHQNYRHADTLRGTFRGVVCYPKEEIDFEFELRYPETTYPCSLSGKISFSARRIDGVVGCTIDSHTTYWKAIYLEMKPPPDDLGRSPTLPQASVTRVGPHTRPVSEGQRAALGRAHADIEREVRRPYEGG